MSSNIVNLDFKVVVPLIKSDEFKLVIPETFKNELILSELFKYTFPETFKEDINEVLFNTFNDDNKSVNPDTVKSESNLNVFKTFKSLITPLLIFKIVFIVVSFKIVVPDTFNEAVLV